EPFEGQIETAGPQLEVVGVPNSADKVLSKGKAVTATVKIFNHGLVKKDFLADARLGQRSELILVSNNIKDTALPLSSASTFLVPPGTDQAVFSAKGSVPIIITASPFSGGLDRLGEAQPNNTAVATASNSELAPGNWIIIPAAVGPFSEKIDGVT